MSGHRLMLRALPVVTLLVVSTIVGAIPVRADPVVPYTGPAWMSKVALAGDSFTSLSSDVFTSEMQKEWWRTASWSFGGVRVETMREAIREMAADRPDAFVVQLGGNDVLPLITGEYDFAHEQAQIAGVLDDITAAGVPCVVWAGPNGHFDDGGVIDQWTKRVNDEIRSQLVQRGNGVFADWTPVADAHPEYVLPFDKHLTEEGKHAYGQMLTESLRNCSRNPHGVLDSGTGGIGVRVDGWAFDPDTDAPIDVHVYVDDAFAGVLRADRSRPDVAAAYPGVVAAHGFTGSVPAAAGVHRVCVYAINVAYGLTNPELGCRSVAVGSVTTGAVDVATGGLAAASVAGWAVDTDTVAPVDVHVYVDGAFRSAVLADQPRPDVGSALPYGDAHGYATTIPGLPAGGHTVCTYAINAPGTTGGNALLGCRTIVVSLGPDPVGAFDAVTRGAGALRLAGWAADPDTTDPIDVHVYVDGGLVTVASAAGSRPDVGAAWAGLGSEHGYDVAVAMPDVGGHSVCVYGINAPETPGANRLIACRTVTVS
jgi:hypothetical protein